jgi:hypothetical protein
MHIKSKGVLSHDFKVKHLIIPIMILVVNIIDLHHGGEHLLPLGRTEVYTLAGLFLENLAVHEPPHLHVLPHHQRLILPEPTLNPLNYQHHLLVRDVSVGLHLVVLQRLLPVLIAILNLEIPDELLSPQTDITYHSLQE